MAPTICSDKKTQIRSGIKDIRKQSTTSSLSASPSSAINYAQKRSKLIRPYPVRGKQQSPGSFRHHISSSSDASSNDDTNELFLSPPSPVSSFSDNSISTSSESSLLSPLSLSSFPSPLTASMTAEACTPCSERLNPFYHNIDSSPLSASTFSSNQDNIENNDDSISRSSSMITSDNISATIITDKANVRPLAMLQLDDQAKNTKGLFEIAIKTIKLVRRNQLLQRRLAQLQMETSEFIQSVMANPENRALRNKMHAKSSEMI